MARKHKFKVRSYDWHNGKLTSFEHVFEKLEEAIAFSKALNDQIIKVYNEYNELVHQVNNEDYIEKEFSYA